MTRAVIVLVFAMGCIEPTLVPCGNQLCPSDTTCVADRCVRPEALSACDGRPEGDSCTLLDANGQCRNGVCELIRCGNGVLDPGEACDDGNTADGDGCRYDCLSDLACGNGILDPGERCDCGSDAATKPDGCPGINDDDVGALCDTHCSRYCGDGAVTGFEACDSTSVAATCGDFGFYSGSVACSPFCTLVPSCTGKCGDGIIQSSHGELCDGAPPTGLTCAGLGRNYGEVGCSSYCSPDIAGTCSDFGPRLMISAVDTEQFTQAATTARGAIAIDSANSQLVVSIDDNVSKYSLGEVTQVRSTGDALIALGPTSAARFDAGGPSALPDLGAFVDVVSDEDSVYAVDSSCAIKKLTGPSSSSPTVGSVSSPSLSGCQTIDIHDGVLAVGGANGVAWQSGSSWTIRSTSSAVARVAWKTSARLLYVTGSDINYVDVATNTTGVFGTVNGTYFAMSSNGIWWDSSPAFVVGANGFFHNVPFGIYEDEPAGQRSGDGTLALWRTDRVYRLVADWGRSGGGPWTVAGQPDGSLVTFDAYSNSVYWSGSDGNSAQIVPIGSFTSMAGPADGTAYLGNSEGSIYRLDNGLQYTLEYAGTAGHSTTVYAQGANGWAIDRGPSNSFTILRRNGGTWSSVPNPCVPSSSGLGSPPTMTTTTTNAYLYCGSGTGVLYVWGSSDWNTVVMPQQSHLYPVSIASAADGTLFAYGSDFGQDGLLRLDGTTWTILSAPTPSHFAARSRDDAYLTSNNVLYHWDGTQAIPISSPVTITGLVVTPAGLFASTPDVLASMTWFGARPVGL